MNAVLRERDLSVDFGFSSPDFVVGGPVPFTVEAVVASHALDTAPEHSHDDAEIPEDLNDHRQ